jgi:hypothetical protein
MPILKSGFGPLGLYACVDDRDVAEIAAALIARRGRATAAACAHAACRRHGGWRVDADSSLATLKNAVLDADIAGRHARDARQREDRCSPASSTAPRSATA